MSLISKNSFITIIIVTMIIQQEMENSKENTRTNLICSLANPLVSNVAVSVTILKYKKKKAACQVLWQLS